ncbi:MAG TPA: DMT family transporter [Thermohalobaculum sp.]|nr:DMT family transporter [Thermohalobaculum sp.]
MTTATASVGTGRPIGLILIAMMAFSTQDVAVKLVAPEVSLWQLQAVRSLATLVLLFLLVAAMGKPDAVRPKSLRWPLVRAGFMCASYLCFYASLPLLPLSQAAATFFTGPLIITVLAAFLLGEPIGPRRVIAVIVGFAGVLCIIRPGAEGWQPVALLPLLSAVSYATGVTITRWRCRDESNYALSAVHNAVYVVVGVLGLLLVPLLPWAPETRAGWPFLTDGWLPLTGFAFGLMLFTAATHLVGVLTSVRAYQIEDASRIAPFEYSYLLLMPIYDVVLWGNWPQPLTLVGMALICGAGVFVAWREGRPPRPQVHPRGEDPWTPDAEKTDKGA